jgi:tRNA (guanine-N7-)-methyltransferase
MSRPLSQQIERHLLAWRAGPWPPRWDVVFGRAAPLALEIGFGNGAFLVEQAQQRAERDHVGVELSWTSATHLFRRLDASGLRNVRAVLGDARVTLEHLFAPASLEALFVNHPCPWPKARHEDRRLLDARFLALAAHRMRPGAELLIVTDHDAYAEQVRATLAAQDWFESRHATAEVAEIPDRRPTKYEAKARAQGAAIHYFEWIRVRAPDILPASPRPDPDRTMLSLTLRGPHDAERSLSGFEPRLHREVKDGVEVVVRLVAAYRRVGGGDGNPLWMVETLVKEDELLQECAIAVVAARSGELLVKLSSLGRALPTYGVKRAVWLVGELLREQAPELVLVHENLGAEIVS